MHLYESQGGWRRRGGAAAARARAARRTARTQRMYVAATQSIGRQQPCSAQKRKVCFLLGGHNLIPGSAPVFGCTGYVCTVCFS
jgi:hypothetical protein